MTAISYGRPGVMLTFREDHAEGDFCLCSPPNHQEYGQRGCPTTGLPVAPVWRPRAPRAVTDDQILLGAAHHRVAEIQPADHCARHDAVEQDAPELAAGGVA